MKKLIISNSQGTYKDTDGIPYTEILADEQTYIYAKSGLDIKDILNEYKNIFNLNKPEIVIIQIGIIEVANRILSDRTKKFFYKFGYLGKIITKFIWINRYNWLKLKKLIGLKDYQKMTISEFRQHCDDLINKLLMGGVKKVYIISIPLLCQEYLKKENPYINEIITEANIILQQFENEKIKFIDMSKLLINDCSNYMSGTVHFSKQGHKKIALFLKSNIEEFK